ncbi:cobaltochelatase subunit CobN [Cupriavidus basilensis]
MSPAGRQRRDTLLALGRFPVGDGKGAQASLLTALAADLALGGGFDPLDADWSAPWKGPRPAQMAALDAGPWRHHGDTRERLEMLATALLDAADAGDGMARSLPQTAAVLARLHRDVMPRLDACGPQEMLQLSRGLAGRFVPPGPSGRTLARTARCTAHGAQFLLGRYARGAHPHGLDAGPEVGQPADRAPLAGTRRISAVDRALVWGTATMRSGGDDIAQAFALLGVRPKWAPGSYRVTDFEILPMAIFDRPRVDVTLRVSGFFRDAFANVMRLFDAAVQAVAETGRAGRTQPGARPRAKRARAAGSAGRAGRRGRAAARAGAYSARGRADTARACRI